MIRAKFWNIVGTVMYWTANKLWKLHAIAFGKPYKWSDHIRITLKY